MEFKIGDKVRCIQSFGSEYSPKKGETFIVTSISNDWYIGFKLPRLVKDHKYTIDIASGHTANWGHRNFKLVVSKPNSKANAVKLLKLLEDKNKRK